MAHSREVMNALADAYGSALNQIITDAIEDGFWFSQGDVSNHDSRLTDIDINWGVTVTDGGYRKLFEEQW